MTGRTQESIHQYASDIHDSINQFASDIGLTQLFEPWFELIEDAGEQLKAFSGHQGLDDFVTQTLQLGFAKAIAKAIFVGLLGLVIFTCLVLFSWKEFDCRTIIESTNKYIETLFKINPTKPYYNYKRPINLRDLKIDLW